MDHRTFIEWLKARLEKYRGMATTSDNDQFHFDSKAAEVAAILEAIESDAYCIDRVEIDDA